MLGRCSVGSFGRISMGGFQFSLTAFASIQLPALTCPMITVSGATATI